MATDAGTTSTPVGKALASRTPHFSFMQAMWLLQRSLPQSAPVGYQGPLADEAVRLRPSTSLGFPPCDIESIEVLEDGDGPAYRLTTTFLGLYGAHSPLPSYYAEDILHNEDDNPVRDFLDIFSHRLLSLFYRGLLRYRGYLLYQDSGADEFSWRLLALGGMGTDDLARLSGLSPAHLLRFTGLLCHKPYSATAIGAILTTALSGLKVCVQQCIERWVYFPERDRFRLGRRRLGIDATLGTRMRDRTGKFRLVVGPVDFETYRRFLPGGEKLTMLSRLARLTSGGWLDFDFEIVLRGEDTPRLGVTLSRSGVLGRTAGLFARPSADLPVRFAPCPGTGSA